MKKSILKIRNLKKIYHTKKEETLAVENFSLDLKEGEFVSIVGPSGCGKSTILSILCGLLEKSDGDIFFDENIRIGYMLQEDSLLEFRTILKNCLLGLEIKKELTKENIDYVIHLLETYGLKDFINSYPENLSGGMRQRVALIRTLATKPDILLLDEPFSALDYQTDYNLRRDLKKYTQDATTLIVAQRIGTIIEADKIIVLDNGEVVGMGTHQELLKNCSVYQEIAKSQFGEEELQ